MKSSYVVFTYMVIALIWSTMAGIQYNKCYSEGIVPTTFITGILWPVSIPLVAAGTMFDIGVCKVVKKV
jgi:hypothetical protein